MLHELDQRKGDGLTVTLEWDSHTGHVQVRCQDERSPDHNLLCYPVAPCNARLAFLHPFALSPFVERSHPEDLQAGFAGATAAGDAPATGTVASNDFPFDRSEADDPGWLGEDDMTTAIGADETVAAHDHPRLSRHSRPEPGDHSGVIGFEYMLVLCFALLLVVSVVPW